MTATGNTADRLRGQIENGSEVDASEAISLQCRVSTVIERLAILEALCEVREWDVAEQAEINRALAEPTPKEVAG
jgi:hypothetical protein